MTYLRLSRFLLEPKGVFIMRTKNYPAACRSMSCGHTTCPKDCPYLTTLNEFKTWGTEYGAVIKDPLWLPKVYTATK